MEKRHFGKVGQVRWQAKEEEERLPPRHGSCRVGHTTGAQELLKEGAVQVTLSGVGPSSVSGNRNEAGE